MIPHCVRCGAPAGTVMAFAYEARLVWLEDLDGPVVPGAGYAYCAGHADRFTAPVGWMLLDRRGPARRLFASLEVA
jgi:hypothetical protein